MLRRTHRSARGATRSLIEGPQVDWDLGRLKLVLLLGVGVCLLVLAGLGATVIYALRGNSDTTAATTTVRPAVAAPSTTSSGSADTASAKAAIVTRVMPQLPDTAAEPGPLVLSAVAPITIPKPTTTGPVGVPTGFPRTPEGAIGQLAAIDETTMSTASLSHAQQVIGAWATPDGPTATSWTGAKGMASILGGAKMPSEAQGRLSMVFTVSMGQIKGTVGSDWALVCVDGALTLTADATGRAAMADCQQMTWVKDRWMISGAEPAQASDVWPGTQAAYDTGWKDLNRG